MIIVYNDMHVWKLFYFFQILKNEMLDIIFWGPFTPSSFLLGPPKKEEIEKLVTIAKHDFF